MGLDTRSIILVSKTLRLSCNLLMQKNRNGCKTLPMPYTRKKMQTSNIPVVPHKAVAEVSKIGTLKEGLVVVTRGWQSEPTDGPKGA